jgi:hypothetical protein
MWLFGGLTVHAQAPTVPPSEGSAPLGYDQLYEQAVSECASGNFSRAKSLFMQAHELNPNAYTLRGLGLTELELGDAVRAQGFLERALSSNVRPLGPALRANTEELLARAQAMQSAPSAPVAQTRAAPRMISPAPMPNTEPASAPPEAQPLPGEAPPPRATGTAVAGALYVSAILPFEGYAQKTQGIGVDAGAWIQLDHLVLEPRAGIRTDAGDDKRGYVHIPLELGTYFLGPIGDHALFIGPGVGLHALFEQVDVRHTVGTAIPATSHDTIHDNAVGFGTFLRAGAVLLRTRVASVVPCVDYAITFADFKHGSYEHALRINVGVLMGGGR